MSHSNSKSEAKLQVTADAQDLVQEREHLTGRIKQLEVEAERVAAQRKSMEVADVLDGGWKPMGLIRKLAQKQEELNRMQVCLHVPAVSKKDSLSRCLSAASSRCGSDSCFLPALTT